MPEFSEPIPHIENQWHIRWFIRNRVPLCLDDERHLAKAGPIANSDVCAATGLHRVEALAILDRLVKTAGSPAADSDAACGTTVHDGH